MKKRYWDRLVGLGHKLLLVDGIGALLSTILTGGVLAHYHEVIGMPREVLLLLAAFAVVFMIYSFSSYRWAGDRWRPCLRVIAWVNIAYCVFTLAMMYAAHASLRAVGVVYFVLEILVILGLAFIELAASRSFDDGRV